MNARADIVIDATGAAGVLPQAVELARDLISVVAAPEDAPALYRGLQGAEPSWVWVRSAGDARKRGKNAR
jgi:hypothetical protein